MEIPNENEQWLLVGNCSKCRRFSYCRKPCTIRQRETKAEMKHAVVNVMNQMTGGIMKEQLTRAVDCTII